MDNKDEKNIRESIIQIGKRMYEKGFIVASDGNISARTGENQFIVTPSGLCKGFLNEEDLLITDFSGQTNHPSLRPSSEIFMHLAVYRERPDIYAVIHAHPSIVTAFSLVNISFEEFVLPEIILTLGKVPIANYATPGTEEGAYAIEKLIKCHDAIILARHGAITAGNDLLDAYFKMERMEHAAKTMLAARLLGTLNPLSSIQIAKLLKIKEKPELKTQKTIAPLSIDNNEYLDLEKIVSLITEEIIKHFFE